MLKTVGQIEIRADMKKVIDGNTNNHFRIHPDPNVQEPQWAMQPERTPYSRTISDGGLDAEELLYLPDN